jgi:hypothetical protein
MKSAGIGFDSVVHGGQTVRIQNPIPPSGDLVTSAEIVGIYDLKRVAQIVVRTHTTILDAPAFETEWSILVLNGGGFGGKPPKSVAPASESGSDLRISKRPVRQALSPQRRLNPLHADTRWPLDGL